jgi:hypothetical protein
MCRDVAVMKHTYSWGEKYAVRFEVFMVVRMMTTFFWVLAPCRLIGRCQCFGEKILFPSSDGRWRQTVYTVPKPRRTSSSEKYTFQQCDSIALSLVWMSTEN